MLIDATIIRLEIQCEPASVPNHSKGIRCVTSFASVEQKTVLLGKSVFRSLMFDELLVCLQFAICITLPSSAFQ